MSKQSGELNTFGVSEHYCAGKESRKPETSIDIVIGTNSGTLEARVFDGRHQPVARATVVLIPESSQRFRTAHKFALTDAAGQALIRGVAPGNYKIFAWEDIEKGAWQDPAFVRNHEPSGKVIHINEGENAPTEVIVIAPKP